MGKAPVCMYGWFTVVPTAILQRDLQSQYGPINSLTLHLLMLSIACSTLPFTHRRFPLLKIHRALFIFSIDLFFIFKWWKTIKINGFISLSGGSHICARSALFSGDRSVCWLGVLSPVRAPDPVPSAAFQEVPPSCRPCLWKLYQTRYWVTKDEVWDLVRAEGVPVRLSQLSVWPQLTSWPLGPGIEPCIVLPAQHGACFSLSLAAPLLQFSLSLSLSTT